MFVEPHVIIYAASVFGCQFESQSVFECRRYKRNFVVYESLLIGMFTSSLRFCISPLLTSCVSSF